MRSKWSGVQGSDCAYSLTLPHPHSLTPWIPLHTEKRKAEAERIRQKYPDRIPVSVSFKTMGGERCFYLGPITDTRAHSLSGHL